MGARTPVGRNLWPSSAITAVVLNLEILKGQLHESKSPWLLVESACREHRSLLVSEAVLTTAVEQEPKLGLLGRKRHKARGCPLLAIEAETQGPGSSPSIAPPTGSVDGNRSVPDDKLNALGFDLHVLCWDEASEQAAMGIMRAPKPSKAAGA